MDRESKPDPAVNADDLTDFVGRFLELEQLSTTSRRETFLGIDVVAAQPVFIKMLSSELASDAAAVRAFHDEPRVIQAIASRAPSFANRQINLLSSWNGRPYFVQPYIHGWSLSHAMRKRAAFNVHDALRVVEQCLCLLAEIHNAGFIHGDLSPENIVIATDGLVEQDGTLPAGFTAHIVDFESARSVDRVKISRHAPLVTKLPYLAPELLQGKLLSPQADLYALGIVLYEMLTGSRPYRSGTKAEVRALKAESIPPIPMMFDIPALIESFLGMLIDLRPEQRFATASEALNHLRRIFDVAISLNKASIPEANQLLHQQNVRESGVYTRETRVSVGTKWQLTSEVASISLAPPESSSESGIVLSSDEGSDSTGSDDGISLYVGNLSNDDGDDEVSFQNFALSDDDFRMEISSAEVPLIGDDGEEQLVDFSVFAPNVTSPGLALIIDVWAYLDSQRREMLEQATARRRQVEVGSRGNLLVPSETQLMMSLRLDSFQIDNPQEPFYWTGRPKNVSFLVSSQPDLIPGHYPGKVSILHDGMLICNLLFEIAVRKLDDREQDIAVEEVKGTGQRVRTAFASYSSKDRDEVARRVQGMSAVGVDVFMDVVSLRAGQLWDTEIIRNIGSRDAFYLFWSENARQSKNVEREWKHAILTKGLSFIHPIPLVNPQAVPPPPELNDLHFNDIFLMFLPEQDGDSGVILR